MGRSLLAAGLAAGAWLTTAWGAHGTEFGGMVLGPEAAQGPLLETLRGAPSLRWIRGPVPRAAELGFQSVNDVQRLMPRGWGLAPGQLPSDLRAVREAVRAGVEANPGTRVWEVWNEPDFHFVQDPAAEMAAVLKAAWWGVKGARATDRVLMPSLAFRPGRYAVELMQNGAASWTEGYNLHFYGWPSDYGTVLASHRVLAQAAGLRGPWWVTEIGFFQMGAQRAGDPEMLAWQSAFHERAMVESVAEGISVHLAFALSPAREASWDLGLSEPGGPWRPALKAMARLGTRLEHAKPVASLVHRRTGECLGQALSEEEEPEGRWMVFWSAARPQESALPGVRYRRPFPERFRLRLQWPRRVSAVRAGLDGDVALAPGQVAALELHPGQVHHLRSLGMDLPRVEGCDWVVQGSPRVAARAAAEVQVSPAWRRELRSLPPRGEPSPVVIRWRTGADWVPDKPSQTLRPHVEGAASLTLELLNLSAEPVSGRWEIEVPAGWSMAGAPRDARQGGELRLEPDSGRQVNLRLTAETPDGRRSDPGRLTARWEDGTGRADVASIRLVASEAKQTPERWEPLGWSDWLARPGHPEAWQVFEPEPGRVHLEISESSGAQGDVVVRWPAPAWLRGRDAFRARVRSVATRGRVHAQFFLATRDGEIWRYGEWREVPAEGNWTVRAPVEDFAPTLWSRQETFGSPDPSRVRWFLLRLQGAQAGDVLELQDLAWERAMP